jgi:hypothetical protein
MVNGPEDVVPEWEAVDWRLHEDNVRRLRQRIFKAERERDLAAVRNQQTLRRPRGLLELLAVKAARAVLPSFIHPRAVRQHHDHLRGDRRSNSPVLPDGAWERTRWWEQPRQRTGRVGTVRRLGSGKQ